MRLRLQHEKKDRVEVSFVFSKKESKDLPRLNDLAVNVDVEKYEHGHGEDAGDEEAEPVEVVDDVVGVLPQVRHSHLRLRQPGHPASVVVVSAAEASDVSGLMHRKEKNDE